MCQLHITREPIRSLVRDMRKVCPLLLILVVVLCGCASVPRRPGLGVAKAVVSLPKRAAEKAIDVTVDTTVSVAATAARHAAKAAIKKTVLKNPEAAVITAVEVIP